MNAGHDLGALPVELPSRLLIGDSPVVRHVELQPEVLIRVDAVFDGAGVQQGVSDGFLRGQGLGRRCRAPGASPVLAVCGKGEHREGGYEAQNGD